MAENEAATPAERIAELVARHRLEVERKGAWLTYRYVGAVLCRLPASDDAEHLARLLAVLRAKAFEPR